MVSSTADSGLPNTPMMRQYLSVKERHPEEILFFRMGDFYEMFFDDARVASEILGIALTSRSKDPDAVPMAGVPVRAADSYLPRLIQAGRRVAICEQVQDPSEASGLVDREVVRVISPGTITDDNLVDERSNNFLAALVRGREGSGVAWVDVNTGEFRVWESRDEAGLVAELSRIDPAELVLPESLHRRLGEAPAVESAIREVFRSQLPDWCFEGDNAYRALTEHFGTRTLEGFGCEHLTLGIRAAGGLLHYLKETQKNALRHITRIRPFRDASCMPLDLATRQALELTRNGRSGDRTGTLLAALDRTATAMGARRFREWLLKPLKTVDAIVYRQEAVDCLVRRPGTWESLESLLRRIHDLERICTRMSYGSANARDLVALRRSLEVLPEIAGCLEGMECRLLGDAVAELGDFTVLASRIEETLVDDPPLAVREGGLVRRGHSEELDRLLCMAEEGTRWIADFQRRETEATGIPSLKVGFNKVFGYYIEVTNTHANKVPESYIRKQTLKNCERYITPELKDFENQVLHARENAMSLEYRLFAGLRDLAAERIPGIQAAARAVATIDAISSLVRVARERGYVRPEVHEGHELSIIDGRHPVLELVNPEGDFIPNSVSLDGDHPVMVITGPNMAGKSTYIRQVALLTLMAHMGSFIPAAEARIGLVDRIFTRVGAADDISRGQSTFMVEMHETANILNNATDRSLLVLDEVGRGTSTFDGISLAWAVTEHITERLRARTLFATHYHELTELSLSLPQVRNFTFAVKEWNDEIVFMRKVIEGAADKSYGIHVARLAGIPREVLARSRELLANLEAQALDIHGQPSFAPPRRAEHGGPPEPTPEGNRDREGRTGPLQLDLFQDANSTILRRLKQLDVNGLTPLEALNLLHELKTKIV